MAWKVGQRILPVHRRSASNVWKIIGRKKAQKTQRFQTHWKFSPPVRFAHWRKQLPVRRSSTCPPKL